MLEVEARLARQSSSGQLVEKEIKDDNPAVPGKDEISPGVGWCFLRAARYPWDSPAISPFLRLGHGLIWKVRVRGPAHARDAVDLFAASVEAFLGIREHAIWGEDLVHGRTPTGGAVLSEDTWKIAGPQGR
ncbi:MAG: hypothetical protein JO210_12815 [Acidobacteriaceae bacterium]|nr:hypothetical protein [Acidobacteriaceae bacterium]